MKQNQQLFPLGPRLFHYGLSPDTEYSSLCHAADLVVHPSYIDQFTFAQPKLPAAAAVSAALPDPIYSGEPLKTKSPHDLKSCKTMVFSPLTVKKGQKAVKMAVILRI